VTTTAPTNTLNAIITATATGATLTTPLTVQVVSVALSPTEVTIFVGHSQQFLATVTGTSTLDVTWTVQEAAGGTVSTNGLFIGQAVGDFHVVATSVADPTKSGTAPVHVRAKAKDKDKDKDKDKEKERIKEITKEVVKELEIHPQVVTSPRVVTQAETQSLSGGGKAFIQPQLRPSVG
jgi:hypothetical protein